MDGQTRRFEDLLRASVDWTWETDSHGNITVLSHGFLQSFESPIGSRSGNPLIDLAEAAERPAVAAALQDRRAFRHLPFPIRDAKGGIRRYLLNGLPYYHNEDGRFGGFRGTAVLAPRGSAGEADNEIQKRLVGLLAEALERKDELEAFQARSVDDVDIVRLGALAHELCTPLNAIMGFSEIIRDQRFGQNLERYQQYAGLIHDSGRHLLDVVQDLLELADRQSDDGIDRDSFVDPGKVTSFVLIVLDEEAARLGVKLVNDLPASLPKVRGERRALRQILLNLVTNAVKYTGAGGQVRLTAESTPQLHLKIQVSDTGIGIQSGDLERIFERYVRADSVGEAVRGKGLGLAIARDLARELGGDITVVSELGKGSCFTLQLPLPTDSGRGARAEDTLEDPGNPRRDDDGSDSSPALKGEGGWKSTRSAR